MAMWNVCVGTAWAGVPAVSSRATFLPLQAPHPPSRKSATPSGVCLGLAIPVPRGPPPTEPVNQSWTLKALKVEGI